ncbi:hypothetical protein [Streptomyces sp. NBC_00147]|uniref:hypothetical protein n=1 Tax=Streptomyces sp. NBC_00147 TaxID=2975667 RepID=UPI00324BE957
MESMLADMDAGRHVLAPATAHQMFAVPAQLDGTLEHFDDLLIFKREGSVGNADAWWGKIAQVDAVRDGDSPGEIMITFHPGSPFVAIVVRPDRHEDTWRRLALPDGPTPTS